MQGTAVAPPGGAAAVPRAARRGPEVPPPELGPGPRQRGRAPRGAGQRARRAPRGAAPRAALFRAAVGGLGLGVRVN